MYVVRGDFLDFHSNPRYDEKSLPLDELLYLTHPQSPFFRMFVQFKKDGAMMLHDSYYYWGELRNGSVLFMHVPQEDRSRIEKLLWDDKMGSIRDLYIDWEQGLNEFRGFWARMSGIKEEVSKPKHITLDELIGSGEVASEDHLVNLPRKVAKKYIEDTFNILAINLVRGERSLRDKLHSTKRWGFTTTVGYITSEP